MRLRRLQQKEEQLLFIKNKVKCKTCNKKGHDSRTYKEDIFVIFTIFFASSCAHPSYLCDVLKNNEEAH